MPQQVNEYNPLQEALYALTLTDYYSHRISLKEHEEKLVRLLRELRKVPKPHKTIHLNTMTYLLIELEEVRARIKES